MARTPANPTEEQLRNVDREVDELRAAYLAAAERRARYFRNAAKKRSQGDIARIVGKTQQRVQQILKHRG